MIITQSKRESQPKSHINTIQQLFHFRVVMIVSLMVRDELNLVC